MSHFQHFDPLKFLNIENLNNEEKNIVSKKLLDKISQYILIRTSELLPTSDLKNINTPEGIFFLAKSKVPDLDNKVKLFLKDFKKAFYKNIKTP